MTTVQDILEQAKALTADERKELAKLIIDTLDSTEGHTPQSDSEPKKHWGKNLIRLLDELGPIELIYPEIEDPVEWVKQIRKDQMQKRLGDWGEEE